MHCESCYNNYPDTRVEVGEGAFPVGPEGEMSDEAELLVSNAKDTEDSYLIVKGDRGANNGVSHGVGDRSEVDVLDGV